MFEMLARGWVGLQLCPCSIEGIVSDIIALFIPPVEQANGTFIRLFLKSLRGKFIDAPAWTRFEWA